MAWALTDVKIWGGPTAHWIGDTIAFSRQRVLAVGSEAFVLTHLPAGSRVLRGGGRVLVPGFVDAHLHLGASVSQCLSVDCSEVCDRLSLLDRIASAASKIPSDAWVSLAGLEPATIADGLPTRQQLDTAGGGRPVRVRHRSLHGWLLSSRAIELLDLPTESPVLVADHYGAVHKILGRVSEQDEFESALNAWSSARLREGMVAFVDATVTNNVASIGAIANWRRTGLLRQAVTLLTGEPCPGSAGLKIMAIPGPALEDSLRKRLVFAWSSGMVAAVHCAEPDALATLIEVVETIAPDRRGRLRIEHAAVCPPEWLPRVAAIEPTVVTHPSFVHAHGDRYLADASLSPHEWLYRLRSWLRAGCGIAVGSDSPAGPVEPLLAWRSALNRNTASGCQLGPDESLSPEEALSAITAWPAAIGELAGFGSLHAGGPGAAVMLDGDPFDRLAANAVAVASVIADGKEVE
jgi:predicted amidohydrolase YtcJ